jgi:hypothetical protein
MKFWTTWFLAMVVFAGFSARAMTTEASRATTCSHSSDVCCQDHHDQSERHDGHHDGDGCPLDHHHHQGCCSLSQPLAIENHFMGRLGVAESVLLSAGHESEMPPEKPFLSSEKPPLI